MNEEKYFSWSEQYDRKQTEKCINGNVKLSDMIGSSRYFSVKSCKKNNLGDKTELIGRYDSNLNSFFHCVFGLWRDPERESIGTHLYLYVIVTTWNHREMARERERFEILDKLIVEWFWGCKYITYLYLLLSSVW